MIPVALRYTGSMVRYALAPKKYHFFTLQSILTLKRKKLIGIRRIARFGSYYYGTTMRIPRWPSPAFDRMVANGGLNVEPAIFEKKHHIDTAILGITRRCSYDCEHCYDAPNRQGEDSVSTERWIEVIRQLQQTGVSVIVLSGGEPLMRYSALLEILDHGDLRLSDFHIHTSGFGVTPERAAELAAKGLVAAGVGLDYPDPVRQDRFRGMPGAFENAVAALRTFSRAGVFTYTNLCLQKDLLDNGGLYAYLELARQLHVGSIQLLEPRPCGKYGRQSADDLFSAADRQKVMKFFLDANQSSRFKGYPPVAYPAYYEQPENYGCLMGGLSLLSIDGNGNVNPCVFVPVSFGNILEEDFGAIYQRMRRVIRRPFRDTCASIRLSPAIREYHQRSGRQTVLYDQFVEQWHKEIR